MKWLEDLLDRLREAGRYKTLLALETSKSAALSRALSEYKTKYDRLVAAAELESKVILQGFAFASDVVIARWTQANQLEQIDELARLTRALAREQAKVYDLADVNAVLNRELKAAKRGEITPATRAITEELFGAEFDGE